LKKTQKSLITHPPAGRQGLWNDYADNKYIESREPRPQGGALKQKF